MNYEILPIHTKIYEENKQSGLLLTGINHGYSKNDEILDSLGKDRRDPYKSFFSDKKVNNYPFRNNIVKWFKLWGYELASEEEKVTQFEKSIIQTNWLQTCTNNMRGFDTRKACIKDHESFLETCEMLKPKIIFFFSRELMWAFQSDELELRVESIFGKKLKNTNWLQKNIINEGNKCISFKFGFLEYEGVTVVSLPHPTSSRGVSNAYVSAFKPEISEIINSWWLLHKQNLVMSNIQSIIGRT